ncbi:hypothetical protein [Ferruginibacter sp.]|nr:hypothetical protein [Ferruginibacter sp.]
MKNDNTGGTSLGVEKYGITGNFNGEQIVIGEHVSISGVTGQTTTMKIYSRGNVIIFFFCHYRFFGKK